MYCRHCGKKLPDDSRFCTYCGKNVEIDDEAAPAEGNVAAVDDATASDVREPADDSASASDPLTGEPGDAASLPDAARAGEALVEARRVAEPAIAGSAATVAADGRDGIEGAAAEDAAATIGAASVSGATANAGATAPNAASAPDAPVAPHAPSVSHANATSAKRWIPVAIAAAVVVIAAIGIGVFVQQRTEAERIAQEERAEREREQVERLERLSIAHDVKIGISANGWDTDDGSTPLPMHVEGMTDAGDSYEEIQFVDSDGDGISLLPGTYTIDVAASPFAEYGRMYDYTIDPFAVEIGDDLEEKTLIDMSDEIQIELTYPDNLTDDGIERAREIALNAGYDEADELADKAYERYFEDEDDKDDRAPSSSTGSSGVNTRTYDGDFFEIDLPAAWEIDVASGGGDVLARHSVKLEGETILTIDVMVGDEDVSGTITDAGGMEKLGVTSDGNAVIAVRGNGTVAYNSMELIAQTLKTIDID